jgi:Fic family protein
LGALGHFEKRIWEPNPNALRGRKTRRGGSYEAFVPSHIAERRFSLGDEAVTAIATATKALLRLNATQPRLASLNALTSSLLRSESAASSRIEDLAISHRRLARAAYENSDRRDDRATQVLGNVEAMKRAIELGATRSRIGIDDIRDIHRILLRFSVDRKIAGVIREAQNWIGGNDYNPLGAAYVPPPPEHVPPLLEDLCRFLAREDLAPVAHAAIAHAQFENIHPFADGNGRVGRALIHTILRRRGEATRFVPPISLVLAAEQRNYIAGFGAFSAGDVSSWCEVFAYAAARAASEAERMASEIEDLQAAWLERIGNPRRDAVVRRIVSLLPEQPVVDVAAGQRLTGKSHVSIQKALNQLEEAGILRRLNERKWGRVWECDELLGLVEDLEEEVSSPTA